MRRVTKFVLDYNAITLRIMENLCKFAILLKFNRV